MTTARTATEMRVLINYSSCRELEWLLFDWTPIAHRYAAPTAQQVSSDVVEPEALIKIVKLSFSSPHVLCKYRNPYFSPDPPPAFPSGRRRERYNCKPRTIS